MDHASARGGFADPQTQYMSASAWHAVVAAMAAMRASSWRVVLAVANTPCLVSIARVWLALW